MAPADADGPGDVVGTAPAQSLSVMRAVASAWVAAGHETGVLVRLTCARAVQLPAERGRAILAEVLTPLPQVDFEWPGSVQILLKTVLPFACSCGIKRSDCLAAW
jgi:hypothetical protein